MKFFNLVLFIASWVFCFGQDSEVKISKENKKRIIAELKAYMKNPQQYIDEKENQKIVLKGATDEVEGLKKQQTIHAGMLVSLTDSIQTLNEKQKLLEEFAAAKVDSNAAIVNTEKVEISKEEFAAMSAEPAKVEKPISKTIEPIKLEKPVAKTIEPIKIEKTTPKAPEPTKFEKVGDKILVTVKTVEPAKAAEPAKVEKPVSKVAEPIKIEKQMPPNAPPAKKEVVNTSSAKVEAKVQSANSSGKTYRLQVGTFTTFDPAAFNGSKNLMSEKVDATGAKRLLIGDFTNEEEARKVILDLKKLGINGAFVVNYMNGVRVK